MNTAKSFDISRHTVMEAYKRVKENKGAAGVDDVSITEFEENLKDNLYKLTRWLETSHIKQGAVFRRITANEQIGTKSLTPLSVNHLLKKHAYAIGINDFQKLSGHSLRRGFATSAAKAGVSLPIIMRDGRCKQTNTVVEYIEASERFAENAAINVFKTLT